MSIESNLEKTTTSFNAFALLIGVANYKQVSSLPLTVHNDVRDIESVLVSSERCGYPPSNVRVLLDTDASLKDIRTGLSWLASVAGQNDSVLIYFSGHGALLNNSLSGESALVPWDAESSNLPATCLSEVELSESLQAIKSARLLVLLDSCHSGGSVAFKAADLPESFRSGFDEKGLERLAQGRGRVAIASSRSSETSLILSGALNSVFTAHLLEVLRGETPSTGEGLIRVFQVFEHLAAAVPTSTKDRQHPILKASALEKNFPVALERGGVKQLTPNRAPALPASFDWKRFEQALSQLYPSGPTERELWARAGGDLSRLKLSQVGRATWFSSLLYVRQGGANTSFVKALMNAALEDFPHHSDLLELSAAF